MKQTKQPPTQAQVSDLERQVEVLQRDIRNLQLEHDLLKKASEIIKKDLGVSLQLLSNQEKTTLVDAPKDEYPVSQLLGRLALARSSYFRTSTTARPRASPTSTRRSVAPSRISSRITTEHTATVGSAPRWVNSASSCRRRSSSA